MNILLSHFPVMVSGGAEHSTLDLGVALYGLGHKVYISGPWSNCQNFVSIANAHGLRLIEPKMFFYPAGIFELRNLCKALEIDVIISSSRRYNIISHFAVKGLPTVHIPVLRGPISSWDALRPISRLHSSTLPLWRAFWFAILRREPVIICISKAIAEDVRKILHCPHDQTPVIYNAIGVTTGNVITPIVQRKTESPFRLILVGRLHPEKRPQLIVPLMQEVLKYEKDVVADIAGDGEYRNKLSELVRSAGLGEHIRLMGHCEDIVAVYQTSHILVHFRNDEGFGRIYLEAQMNGIPVVCIRGGAASEVICEGESGYLHDLQDLEGMAKSIIKLKRDKVLYQAMSQKARDWARENFSLSAMAQRYEEVMFARVERRTL